VQCFDRAISQKADLILMEGLDPTYLQPQIKAARKAGIKTLATFALDPAMPKSLAPNVTSYVLDPFTPAARLMADWAIHDMKGRTNALVITSNEFRPSAYMVRAIQNEFRTRCATCKVKVVNIPIPDWATKMQSAVQSELLKDSGINYIIPLFDSMSQYVAPAITAAGGSGKIFISTFNGTPFALKMIQDGDIVRQNVGQSMKWLASSNIDAAMRLLLGLKPVVDQQTPLRMFTKSNVNQAGKPPTNHGGYGNAYVQGYNRLWRAG
jgi:ribose transport system substrate-binding protein